MFKGIYPASLIGSIALGSLAAAQGTQPAPIAPAAPVASAAVPAVAAAPTTATKPVVLPGNGMAGHDFLYAGEWDTRKPVQTAYIVKGGKVAWSYEIPSGKGEISDCSLLSNGNVIIAHQHGALVVSPDKQVLWSYACATTATEVHTIQAIGLDKVMIFVNGNPAKVMTFDIKTNTMEKSFEVAVGNPKSTHGQVRRMRITPQGTILIAIQDAKRVDEYGMDGKKLATTSLNGVWDAVRLKNGNMLVTTQKTHVQELDKDGKVVWELQPSDLPGIPIFQFQEANRLDNGNTVMTNWIPNTFKAPQWPGTMQVLEVTPEKKPVWGLSQWSDPDLGPATCFQVLGQSGTPEEHTMQR